MADIDIVATGTDYITVKLIGLDPDYHTNDRKCQWKVDGKSKGSKMSIPKEVEESSSRKLSGLDPGTEYEITAVIEFTLNPDYGTVELSTTASTDDADFGGSLDITATTANSISARLIDMNSDYPKHRMRITWLIAGSEK